MQGGGEQWSCGTNQDDSPLCALCRHYAANQQHGSYAACERHDSLDSLMYGKQQVLGLQAIDTRS